MMTRADMDRMRSCIEVIDAASQEAWKPEGFRNIGVFSRLAPARDTLRGLAEKMARELARREQ